MPTRDVEPFADLSIDPFVDFSKEQLLAIDELSTKYRIGTVLILKEASNAWSRQQQGFSSGLERDSELIQLVQQFSESQWRRLAAKLDTIETNDKVSKGPRQRTYLIRSKVQLLSYSRALIVALEEVLSYDIRTHHNQPPPALWMENPEYIEEVRRLVSELHRLNNLLETTAKARANKQTSRTILDLSKCAQRFAENYSDEFGKAAGKGTWYLLIAGIGALLYQAGVAQGVIDQILEQIKTLR
jgi:hypothetical protein